MRQRLHLLIATGLLVLTAVWLVNVNPVSADSPSLARTYTVGFVYVTTYKNRLENALAAVNQMQQFFDTVQWKQGQQYSFLRDVVHSSFRSDDGYVDTPLGFGYGSCGASSLLNKLVKTARFRDKDGVEKPVFESVLVWTWRGDKTYGKWGATIFIDPAGMKGHQTKDYVWKLNPDYQGPPPKITTHFDMTGETDSITMQYADAAPPPAATPSATDGAQTATEPTATPTSAATVKAAASVIQLVDYQVPQPTKSGTKAGLDSISAPGNSGQAVVRPAPDATAQSLTESLTALIKEDRFGVSVIPIGDASLIMSEVGVNQDTEAYVASAFKGPVAIYFFENVDPLVWRDVPVQYWLAKTVDDVPAEYQASWSKNKDTLADLYQSAIFSDNDSTGNILAYVYNNSAMKTNGDNPIIAFNNWLHDSAGTSESTGLKSWLSGGTRNASFTDDRYGKYSFSYRNKVLIPTNTFSPHDLAQVYVHLATKGRELGYYDKAIELLSTTRGPTGLSMIQYHLRKRGIQTASKDGFVGPDSADSDGFYISTDAGLLTLPDGSQFAVSFMAMDAGNLLDDAVTMVGKSLVPDERVAISIGSAGQ